MFFFGAQILLFFSSLFDPLCSFCFMSVVSFTGFYIGDNSFSFAKTNKLVLSSCTGTQGKSHCIFFVAYCLVFCIGSCVPVHDDRTNKLMLSFDAQHSLSFETYMLIDLIKQGYPFTQSRGLLSMKASGSNWNLQVLWK